MILTDLWNKAFCKCSNIKEGDIYCQDCGKHQHNWNKEETYCLDCGKHQHSWDIVSTEETLVSPVGDTFWKCECGAKKKTTQWAMGELY